MDGWAADTSPLENLMEILGAPVASIDAKPHASETKRSLGLAAPPAARLALDARVRRMVRSAISSRAAVMLVGPPGTGKTQLVGETLSEVADNPSAFGMTKGHEKLEVTPDESWSTRELVGGDTVDDKGRIRFSPGYLLEAIAQDRWLVLDEANRADMDRIFGGMLTWLSGESVTVGRVSSDPDAESVLLVGAMTLTPLSRGSVPFGAMSPGRSAIRPGRSGD